ncbi:MAG: hypothetical protein MUO50_10625 [Longimicrobiales bacterium]|nr:hypothetical protein [Longimicrobiales bacterium]
MPSDRTLAYGKRVAEALLGLDALYRKESKDGDGLVVLNMDTAGALKPDSFRSYGDAGGAFAQLREEAAALSEADRRLYYDQLCHSKLAFIRWRQEGLAFQSQLGDFLHVPVQPASELELTRLEEKLRSLLTRMGYSGGLKTQCAGWEDRNRVPPDEVEGVLTGLLDEAWDRTEEELLEIPAHREDGMRVAPVSGVGFNARCNYLGRTIELNIGPTLTLPGLKHLAVHEGYPGHYVQFKLRETLYREGAAPADVLLSVVNTASSSVFEGIADAGMEMMNWIDSDDDRVLGLLNRHRAAIGTGAAWRLHALGWAEEEVSDWLRSQSLVGGEGWVANRMGFISAPSRAVLIWSYWWGEQVVAPAWRRIPESRRLDFLHFLYGRMHSNSTVEMFS